MTEVAQPAPVGVLVVHGIGAQQRGETLAKLWNGLRRVFPQMPAKPVEGEPVVLGARTVRFYEVYWADLLTGERVFGTFDMDEFSSLAWFPFFNQRRRVYAEEPYPLWTVFRHTIVLPFVGFASLVTYFGARLLAQLWDGLREQEAGSAGSKMRFIKTSNIRGMTRSREYTRVDKLLDEFAADVFNYVNSAGDTFRSERAVHEDLRHVYREIIDRFYDQLLRARNDGCQSIQVVAHSLGTVVMYHALRGLRLDEATGRDRATLSEATATVEHLYTIGSPLEKIRFFWPRLRTEMNLAGQRTIPWDNFVSYFDPVAGMLRRYREWGEVSNHKLLGGGFVSGHVVYERSPVFLGKLTQGLLGEAKVPPRTSAQRWKDGMLLLGETLIAPAGLLGLLVAGAAIMTMAVLMLPFLVSLPFRLFLARETWEPIYDYVGLAIGLLMLFVFMVVPALKAKDAFSRKPSSDAGERGAS